VGLPFASAPTAGPQPNSGAAGVEENQVITKLTLWAAAVVALNGCMEQTELNVECTGDHDGVRCILEHQKGNKAVKACWDVSLVCRNGTSVHGSACQVVEPASKAIARIPAKELVGLDRCDVIQKSSVDNRTAGPPD